MDCYRCGQEGHRRNDCPARYPAPAASPPSASAEPTPQPPAPPGRRADWEIADPAPWADQVRQQMGWSHGQHDEELTRMAKEQVVESRADRLADWFPAG